MSGDHPVRACDEELSRLDATVAEMGGGYSPDSNLREDLGLSVQADGKPVCLASTPRENDLGFLASSRCETETHDTCPLHLVKMLHGLRPLSGRRADELRTS